MKRRSLRGLSKKSIDILMGLEDAQANDAAQRTRATRSGDSHGVIMLSE